MAELYLLTCFLEVSVENVLPTAYVDACTTKFYFCKLFLAVPICASRETSEKTDRMADPTCNVSLTRDIPSSGTLVGLLLLLC